MRLHKYYKLIRVDYEDEGLFEISNRTSTPGTITVNNQGIMYGASLQYSTDGANWTTAVFSSNVCEIALPANGNCYFKGTNFYKYGQYPNAMFNCDVNHNVKGNLYSLVDPVNYASATASYDWMFRTLFSGNTHLVDAGGLVLPVGVTSILMEMLAYAFENCSSLTTPPDLSNVTSIGNYGLLQAFYGCTSLTTAPDLSSVTSIGERGLYNAFNGCTSLTTPPDLSSVTSIGERGLQNAFNGCSKLQTIYAPNVDTWDTSKFSNWVSSAGSQAATPKQMIFQTQALLDACPSGDSGFGSYSKILAS